MFAKVQITHHALWRMMTRYHDWQAYSDSDIRARLTKMAFLGTPVGGQIQDDLAVEITLDTQEKIYLVGRMASQTFVVRTVLSKEQLIANMRSLDIRSPTSSPTREKKRHQRYKKSEHYRNDHKNEDEPNQHRTRRDQRRNKKHRPRFDDETLT